MNPFSTYRIIDAENIIKANIRSNYILDDVRGLLNALEPVSIITKPGLQKAAGLHPNVIQKLDTKSHTLDLLKYFGYQTDGKGNYVYQSTSSSDEMKAREDATIEFHRFYNDLKKIKDNSLNGFEEFIKNSSNRPRLSLRYDDDDDDEYEEQQSRPQSSMSFRPPSPFQPPRPMPNFSKVKEGNEKTSQIISSFKESIVSRHGGQPAHSFIRRKLLLLLFKQKYPNSIDFGDDLIDGDIDQRIARLKDNIRNQDIAYSDEVYYECLIRADFDHNTALDILRHNPPNLKPPPEPVLPRGPTTTTIQSSMRHLNQHQVLINANTAENGAAQMLIHEGDEWKNVTHLVTAIIELRQKYNTEEVNDLILSKMHRLIYSELLRIVRELSSLKIELLAYALCKVSLESLKYLNVVDIRDIINSTSNTQIREDFQDNTIKSLSLECPICGDSYPRSRMETMFLCNHMCCLTCVKDYYRNTIKEIRDSEALKKLTCFDGGHEISDDVKLNFFQYLGTKLNQWFTDERLILDAYHENLFIATRDSQIKKCSNPRCVSFFDIDNNNNRIVRARCPHCQFEQCQQCSRKWHNEHTGMSCEDYADWLRDNDPDDPEVQLTKYLNTAGMMCPNERCKAIYEYQAGGCEHFRCPSCQTEFCRICSALFYNPEHNTICPRPNCGMKTTVHAHCYLNCFREIRDAAVDQIIRVLTAHQINVTEDLRQKPIAIGPACPVEGCKSAPSVTCENRFCDRCYKQFLCLFIWRNQIEPWELYEDNNLRQKLTNASVAVPANATRPALIALAQQHLTQFLGKPKKIERIRQ